MKLITVLFFLHPLYLGFAAPHQSDLLDVPDFYQANVLFWQDIYAKFTTNQGVLHDADDLSIVYETLDFGEKTGKSRRKVIDNAKFKIRKVLNNIAKYLNQSVKLDEYERTLQAKFRPDFSGKDFIAAGKNIRFQLGQKDKFIKGIKTFLMIEDQFRSIFWAHGLPEDLIFLPQVESSFNVHAYSKFGAAGMWQFTRSTGRLFMVVDYTVDERLDVEKSTHAAAQLLKLNFTTLNSWPLALTAYNHGLQGMQRAQKKHGDFENIYKNYKGRAYGFASKNFYAEFLAARNIMKNYEQFFGKVIPETPPQVVTFTVPDFVDVKDIAEVFQVSLDDLKKHNLALRDLVWTSEKYIPKGFNLKVPARAGVDHLALYTTIPESQRHVEQRPTAMYVVSRGDSLSAIAKKFGVSISLLKEANFLHSSRVFLRQRLRIPVSAKGVQTLTAMRDKEQLVASAVQTSTTEMARTRALAMVRERLEKKKVTDSTEPELLAQNIKLATDTMIQSPPKDQGKSLESDGIAKQGVISKNPPKKPMEVTALKKVHEGKITPIPRKSEPAVDELAGSPRPKEKNIPIDTKHEKDIVITPADVKEAQAEDIGPLPEETADETVVFNASEPVSEIVSEEAQPSIAEPTQNKSEKKKNKTSTNQTAVIIVEPEETLGHYAEWLEIKITKLRRLNNLHLKRNIRFNQKIILDLTKVSLETFQNRRYEYHKMIEEDFFHAYRITEVGHHTIGKGDNLFSLCFSKFEIPAWLLVSYNPKIDFNRLTVGTKINVPMIEEISK